MTKLVGDGNAAQEGWKGMVCGVLFGLTAPIVGHPIDSIKTRMQADPRYAKGSAWSTMRSIVRAEGALALYRGLPAPLLGSSIFRSVQFSAYAAAMGAQRDWKDEIPGAAGLQWRVITSGLFASTARALTEAPLEYVKVRRQMGQRFLLAPTPGAALRQPLKELRHLYTGFGVLWARTWGLMGLFFIMVDNIERHVPQLLTIPYLGPFVKGGVCATAAWLVVWPFEVLKNQIQAGTPGVSATASAMARARHVIAHQGGVLGLYRGVGPGLLRSLVANGSSMVVYNECRAMLHTS